MDLPCLWNKFKDHPFPGSVPWVGLLSHYEKCLCNLGKGPLIFLWSPHELLEENQTESTSSEIPNHPKRLSPCFHAPEKPWISVLLVAHVAELTERWLVLRMMLTGPPVGCSSRPVFTQRPPLYCPSTVSTGRLNGIYLSSFSSCNYSFSFTMERYTLFGATSYTWQPTKVIICPVFLSFCLSFKTGTGLCFCWSLPFSPCYWCAASFVLTAKKILDCCPVCLQRLMQSLQSKASAFFFLFLFFCFFKIEFTRNKTSSCLWGPCCLLQNFQRLTAWTVPLWDLQMYLKPLDKKKWFQQGQKWN